MQLVIQDVKHPEQHSQHSNAISVTALLGGILNQHAFSVDI